MNIAYHPYTILAAEAYGTGTYACGNFNDGCVAGSSTGTGSGGLAYTGTDIMIPLALAGALIVAGAVLIVTKVLRRRKTSSQS